jgi:hypothetical protein
MENPYQAPSVVAERPTPPSDWPGLFCCSLFFYCGLIALAVWDAANVPVWIFLKASGPYIATAVMAVAAWWLRIRFLSGFYVVKAAALGLVVSAIAYWTWAAVHDEGTYLRLTKSLPGQLEYDIGIFLTMSPVIVVCLLIVRHKQARNDQDFVKG